MVEEPVDRRGGRLTSIQGQELAEWERLIFHLQLSDTWHLGNFGIDENSLNFSRSGRKITTNETGTSGNEGICSNIELGLLNEGRLDRFYISKYLAENVGTVGIVPGTTLSDHMPVILRIEEQTQKKRTRRVSIPSTFLTENCCKHEIEHI